MQRSHERVDGDPGSESTASSSATPGSRSRWRSVLGPAASVAVALAWVLLSIRRTDATFHFAPFVVAVVWSYGRRWSGGRVPRDAKGVRLALGGPTVAVVAALGLFAAGYLGGPSFWGPEGALPEALAMAALGGGWGYRVLTRASSGWLFAPDGLPDGRGVGPQGPGEVG